MENLKDKILAIVGGVVFIGLCVLAYYFLIVRTEYYYTQIDNTYSTELKPNEYEYSLRAYDEHGRIHDVTFKANKKLREDAFLKLTMMSFRGVVNWEEVDYNELPYDVQYKYSALLHSSNLSDKLA